MATGLYSGSSGLALGAGLYAGTPGLWSNGLGLDAGFGGFTPLSLFSAGEQGFWYDPSDFSTLFQDTAGTVPVTAVGQSVARINDKSGRGNHATQSNTSQQPVLARVPFGGRRNLLTYTEEFDNAVWVKNNASITTNAATAPDGTTTADKLVENTALATHFARQNVPITSGVAYTFSVYAKAAERSQVMIQYFDGTTNRFPIFSLVDGTKVSDGGIGSNWTATNVGNGWWRFAIFTTSAGTTAQCYVYPTVAGNNNYTGDGASGIFIWGAQLEVGSTATSYQKVVSTHDVTESGKADCYYLSFDGTDDGMVTGTITPGTDKAQVFAGVRKLSDAATNSLVNFGNPFGATNGSYSVDASNLSERLRIASRGTSNAIATTTSASYAAPLTGVYASQMDISGDSVSGRWNGASALTSATDQGTGNFLAYPAYIGRYQGSSSPFNGHIYALIGRFGASLTTAQIEQAERWVAQKTGVTI